MLLGIGFDILIKGFEIDFRPTPGPPKTPNAFALFVKENYKVHKKPGVNHKDVMSILSQEFAKVKLKNGK